MHAAKAQAGAQQTTTQGPSRQPQTCLPPTHNHAATGVMAMERSCQVTADHQALTHAAPHAPPTLHAACAHAACPGRIRREVADVLPGADTTRLLIVPTCQHSAMDLVQTGERVDQEKDLLLERFMAWAQEVCKPLIEAGHYSDYIDPCSGLPMVHKEGQAVYPEVEALSVLMGYKTSNAGCCKVLHHPRWGSAVYPATMFTTAPVEELLAAIKAAEHTQAPV